MFINRNYSTGCGFNWRIIPICIVASVFCLVSSSQQENVRVLNEFNGLCDNGVNGIITDEWGFLWIATQNGLSRYDGQNCQNFYRSTSTLPSNTIADMVRMNAHHLLLATGNGLVTVDTRTEEIKTFQIEDTTELYNFKNSFDRVIVLPNGFIAAYSKYGFYVFDSAMNVVNKLESDFTVQDVRLKRIHFGLRMDAFPNGDIILATTKGYYIYHAETNAFCELKNCRHANFANLWKLIEPHSANYIFNINREGQLFFLNNKSAAADSLYIFDGVSGKSGILPLPFIPRYEIRWDGKFQFHQDGLITINRSLRGFYSFSIKSTLKDWEQKPVLTSNDFQVFSILYPTPQTEVLGTANGVIFNRKENTALSYFPVPELSNDFDASFIKVTVKLKDRIYFTTTGKSGNVISVNANTGREQKIFIIEYLKQRALVRDMILWNGDTLLLGTTEGLMLLPAQSGNAIPFKDVYPASSVMQGYVHSVWYDGDHALWVSFSHQNGLYYHNLKNKQVVNFRNGNTKNQLAIRHAENITRDREGNMWFHHTEDGLTRYNTKQNVFDIVMPSISIANNQLLKIAGIAAAEKKGLWLYINGFGLYSFDPETKIAQKEITLYDRVESHINPLALSKTGILCLNLKSNLLLYDTRNKTISSVSNPQKNPNLQNNLRRPFFDETASQLLLAYSQRLLLWDLQKSAPDYSFGKVFITKFETTHDNLQHNRFELVKLKSRQNDLRIYFGSPDFNSFSSSQYEFKLTTKEGDENWTSIGSQNFIQFNNLNPGSYTFSVRRVSAVPLQDVVVDSLQFSIASPFYATWWFRTMIGFLILSILYLLYRVKVKQLLKIQAVRTSISADLHDDIGSRHTNAQLLTALARKEAGTTTGVLKYLDLIQSEIGVSSESLNEIVWNMKTGDENLESMIARMRKYAGELLENDQIEYKFNSVVDFHNQEMNMGKRRDTFLIFKEILTNIRKHAKASFVEIDIAVKNGHFDLRISDNGKGFNTDETTDRNGLVNLRQRATRQKGSLKIQSAPGIGTRIDFIVPLNKVSPIKRIWSFISKN